MFRTIISTLAIACAAAIGCVGSASAADMAVKQRQATEAFAAEPLWAGFYVGVHGGYGFGEATSSFFGDTKVEPKGYLVGGQFGYNWQANRSWVLGFVVDGTWLNQVKDTPIDGLTTKFAYMGTIRGRAGVLLTDNILLYGTAGLAFAKHSATFDCRGCGIEYNKNSFGWTGGGGVEVALNRNWSVFGEYLYTDFGRDSILDLIPYQTTLHQIRGGLNFKF